MIVDNVDMATPECAFISRLEGVKREITAIFTMEEIESTATEAITFNFPRILMATGNTFQMSGLQQEIFIEEEDLHKAHKTLLF